MMESMVRKGPPHQIEISCVRCATRFMTPTDRDRRAIRLLCNGCSAVTGQTVHQPSFIGARHPKP